jgi:Integrase core domain
MWVCDPVACFDLASGQNKRPQRSAEAEVTGRIPRYLIRDRDGAYGEIFIRRVRSIGIRDRPTSPRSPWQNAYAERLIGSISRDCLDHIVVFGERHLRHVLLSYMDCYNGTCTHLSLNKDAPISRAAEAAGRIMCRPIERFLFRQPGPVQELILDSRNPR